MKLLRILLTGLMVLPLAGAGCKTASPGQDFLNIVARPPVALAPQTDAMPATKGLEQIHFSFMSDATDRVPAFLIKPASASRPCPVVIALHGTGGSKTNMLALCRQLAARGFVAVAIDGRYHGERKLGRTKNDYEDAIVRAWHGSGEHPFFYDTVWDIMRLIDYLETRDDVDASRIGVIGISKGGIETYLAAAADPRIAVAVPCIGMQSYHWALANNDWRGRIGTIQAAFDAIAKDEGAAKPDSVFVKKFYDRIIPGIDSQFDGPQVMKRIAPRPLLIINSDNDNHTPLGGVNECIVAAEKVYTGNNADHFSAIIQKNAGHKVLPESEHAAIEWFVKWLKP